MPLSKDQLSKILSGHARQLCSAEMNGGGQTGGGFVKNESFDRDAAYEKELEKYDQMLYGNDVDESEIPAYSNISESRMPEAIKRSMMENQIDTSIMDPNASVLRQLNIPAAKKETRRQVTEQVRPVASGVDYSVIKAIVNECLNEYFKNNKLNEGTLAGIGLKGGNITLIDNQGRTYGAKLQLLKDKPQE